MATTTRDTNGAVERRTPVEPDEGSDLSIEVSAPGEGVVLTEEVGGTFTPGAGADATPVNGTIWNLSPRKLVLIGDGGQIELPPLGEEQLGPSSPTFEPGSLCGCEFVAIDHGQESEAASITFGLAFWAAVAGAIAIWAGTDLGLRAIAAWVALCIAVAVAAYFFVRQNRSRVRSLSRSATGVLVLLIGFGIPAVVVAVGSGLFDVYRQDRELLWQPVYNQIVIYRIGQVIFLGLAATFPVILYFSFDRQSGDTLRNTFLAALFRLDDTINSAADWKARYLNQVESAFGSIGGRNRRGGFLKPRNSPVIIATVVLAIGWSMTFLNGQLFAVASGPPALSSPLALFAPERSPVAYAFLGAYVFAVQSVLRSYMRADLRPKAYSQITARVLVVVVLTALLDLLLPDQPAAVRALAFFAGLIPDTILHLAWELVRKMTRLVPKAGDELAEPQPLTELAGIDLYDRSRLAEEGVTNVEALAHGDLVDLLLQTRIPPGRLIDWVDQAVLRVQIDDHTQLDALRSVGIRTATDLLTLPPEHDVDLLRALDQADSSGIGAARLLILRHALSDAEWMHQLLCWRRGITRKTLVVDARPHATAIAA